MNDTEQPRAFFDELMDYIMLGNMIPKVQIERNIGPIIGYFLADVLSQKLNESIIALCPEFPIRKARIGEANNNQSTNIDWLMYSRDKNEIILIELKTTDTSYKHEQAKVYRALQKTIHDKQSAKFLLDELQTISEISNEGGKYRNVQTSLATNFDNDVEKMTRELSTCKRARLIYLAPEVSRPANWTDCDDATWLSFSQLPETLGKHVHSEQWSILRKHLIQLDSNTRRTRNGENTISKSVRNYTDRKSYTDLLTHVQTTEEPVVIGLKNWRKELPLMTLTDLQERNYKWDVATSGRGKKITRNWIAGDDFLSHVNLLTSAAKAKIFASG